MAIHKAACQDAIYRWLVGQNQTMQRMLSDLDPNDDDRVRFVALETSTARLAAYRATELASESGLLTEHDYTFTEAYTAFEYELGFRKLDDAQAMCDLRRFSLPALGKETRN